MATLHELSKTVCDNVKTKKWLSGYFTLQHEGQIFNVGIKAFGKWVQRIECNGFTDGIPEQKTNKALKAEFEKTLLAMIAN